MNRSNATIRALTRRTSPQITKHPMTHQNTTKSTFTTTDSKENDRAHLGIMILRSRVSAVADAATAPLPLAVLILAGGS